MIGKRDFERLVAEENSAGERDQDYVEKWFENHGFDPEMLYAIRDFTLQGYATLVQWALENEKAKRIGSHAAMDEDAFFSAVGALGVGCFQMGWEMHRQYGEGVEIDEVAT